MASDPGNRVASVSAHLGATARSWILRSVHKAVPARQQHRAAAVSASASIGDTASPNTAPWRASPIVPLVALVLCVAAANALAYSAVAGARRANRNIFERSGGIGIPGVSSADPVIGAQTDEFSHDPCALGPSPSCDTTDAWESETVRRIRARATLPPLRDHLARNRYESAFDLLLALISRGEHRTAVNAVASGFGDDRQDTVAIVAFAVRWYLEPALHYRAAGRESDALASFERFTELALPVVRQGYWVSASGLDVTDLPALHHAWCSGAPELSASRCSWGLLDAFARTLERENPRKSPAMERALSADIGSTLHLRDWSESRHGLGLSEAYAGEPPLFTSSVIRRYLDAVDRLRNGNASDAYQILRSVPALSTSAQQALWHYQLGRSALLLASRTSDAAACQRFKREAAVAFRRSFRSDGADGLFARPALARLTETKGLCTG